MEIEIYNKGHIRELYNILYGAVTIQKITPAHLKYDYQYVCFGRKQELYKVEMVLGKDGSLGNIVLEKKGTFRKSTVLTVTGASERLESIIQWKMDFYTEFFNYKTA